MISAAIAAEKQNGDENKIEEVKEQVKSKR